MLLLFWLFLSFELMKLMSFVIFEKFLRIPDEKMSPLSGKYILRKKVLKSFIFSGKKPGLVFHSSEEELEELEAQI